MISTQVVEVVEAMMEVLTVEAMEVAGLAEAASTEVAEVAAVAAEVVSRLVAVVAATVTAWVTTGVTPTSRATTAVTVAVATIGLATTHLRLSMAPPVEVEVAEAAVVACLAARAATTRLPTLRRVTNSTRHPLCTTTTRITVGTSKDSQVTVSSTRTCQSTEECTTPGLT